MQNSLSLQTAVVDIISAPADGNTGRKVISWVWHIYRQTISPAYFRLWSLIINAETNWGKMRDALTDRWYHLLLFQVVVTYYQCRDRGKMSRHQGFPFVSNLNPRKEGHIRTWKHLTANISFVCYSILMILDSPLAFVSFKTYNLCPTYHFMNHTTSIIQKKHSNPSALSFTTSWTLLLLLDSIPDTCFFQQDFPCFSSVCSPSGISKITDTA